MLNDWPCLVLRYQRRMVLGLFDLSRDVFYLTWGLSYGMGCVLDHHPVAQRCEAWVMRKIDVRASPEGKVLLVFIHVRNSKVKYMDISRSRSNTRMLEVLVRVLNRLIQGARFGPDQIAIITPYTAQESAILQAILLTTADRAQGNERDVIIFQSANTRQSGVGFLWDESRINVISTRAKDFMIIIGDLAVDQKMPWSNKVRWLIPAGQETPEPDNSTDRVTRSQANAV
ncbi:hypothetical protein Daus18300_006149 [Diaporthe australafricana]|uniref:DNA2/NAM7 helicase-like C-terminal domain-containing protein n=1 Tax=Diaporthe australafricana TaxID=127596 RepID=A0ABR3WX29_9PEZI